MNFGAAIGTMLSRGAVLTVGLATGIITARALGPEGRGQYFAITTLSAIVAQMGNLGMTSSNIFLAARDSRTVWPLFINGAWLACALVVLSAISLMIFGSGVASSAEVPIYLLWAVSILAPALLFFTLSSSVLVSQENFSAVNGWQIANALLTLIFLGAAALVGQSVEWFVYATACAAVLSALGIGVTTRNGHRGALKFRPDVFAAGWKFASRAYVVLLLGFLMQRASVGILMMYGDSAELGMYSIASQIFDVLVIVPSSVAMIIFPGLVKDRGNQWASIRLPLYATVGVMATICVMVAISIRPVIEFVFGTPFGPASSVVLAILPAAIFTATTTVLSQLVVSRQFPLALIFVWSIGLLLMLVSAMLLVPNHGAVGIGLAQSLGSIAVCAGVIALAKSQIVVQHS